MPEECFTTDGRGAVSTLIHDICTAFFQEGVSIEEDFGTGAGEGGSARFSTLLDRFMLHAFGSKNSSKLEAQTLGFAVPNVKRGREGYLGTRARMREERQQIRGDTTFLEQVEAQLQQEEAAKAKGGEPPEAKARPKPAMQRPAAPDPPAKGPVSKKAKPAPPQMPAFGPGAAAGTFPPPSMLPPQPAAVATTATSTPRSAEEAVSAAAIVAEPDPPESDPERPSTRRRLGSGDGSSESTPEWRRGRPS